MRLDVCLFMSVRRLGLRSDMAAGLAAETHQGQIGLAFPADGSSPKRNLVGP